MDNTKFEMEKVIETYKNLSTLFTATPEEQGEILQTMLTAFFLNNLNDFNHSILVDDIATLIEALE